MAVYQKKNNQLNKKAGLGVIDNILNKFSNHAISNKAVSEEFERINQQLTANTKSFQFAYDSTNQKYGYTIDGTFYPFSSGAILLGTYSANTSIDVSALGAESANQFVISCPSIGSAGGDVADDGDWNWAQYVPPSYSFANGVLSVTAPRVIAKGAHHGDKPSNLQYKVYYVGDIESVS